MEKVDIDPPQFIDKKIGLRVWSNKVKFTNFSITPLPS